jgi:hypothetical protein
VALNLPFGRSRGADLRRPPSGAGRWVAYFLIAVGFFVLAANCVLWGMSEGLRYPN